MFQDTSTRNNKSLTHWREVIHERRAYIEERLAQENRHPLPDFLMVQALKRERLRLKDELTLIEGVVRTVGKPPEPEVA
ncbi:MAG: YdcH family protein [Pseudomonadota bacterium]